MLLYELIQGTNLAEDFTVSIFRPMQDSITISSAVRTAEFASPNEMALGRSTQVSRIPVYHPQLDIGSPSDVSLVDYLLT